ncbi:polysaccharide lyase 6 family protein [Streptomyces sp. A 4/2]|uniref:polysaccharide lyase 6 family protein n=1 Tax=Streptomyces sp. A 4/2 TaxID=2934314 RepID=UPI002023EE8C|nr:polysaccharide lyase 6 family protein [Streptomyces sp. A 4/2]
MHRRTFLTGTALGAALTALPSTARAATPVTSLAALQTAIDAAAPGAVITLADGTYTVPSGQPVTFKDKHGTEAAPITVVAQSRGGAVLKGKQSFAFQNSDNITLSGFSFRQSETLDVPPDCTRIRLTRNDFQLADIEGVHWVMVRADYSKVDRNHFHGKSTLGIFLGIEGAGTDGMAQHVQVLKNYFSDHSYAGDNGGEPIRLGVSPRALSSAHAVIEQNLFERTNGDPEAISVKSSDNVVRHNTLRDSRGGIVLRHGNGTQVDSNWLLGGQEGVRIYGNDHLIVNNYLSGLTGRALVIGSGTERDHLPGEPADSRRGNDAPDRVVIVYNTLLDNADGISGESQRPEEPRDVVVADNLLVGGAGKLVAMAKTVRFTWQSNILFGAAGDGNIPATGFTRVDPKLVAGSDGISRLSAGSPAIDAATLQQTVVTYDIEGNTRGKAPDIGCDEYTTEAPVYRPLTPADVGPDAA